MIIYFIMIAWVAIIGFISNGSEVEEIEYGTDAPVKRTSRLYALVSMFMLIFFYGMRSGIGDTPAYITTFNNLPSEPSLISEYMKDISKYPMFIYLSCLWKCFISEDPQSWLFVMSFICGIGVLIPFRRHSESYWMSVVLFILGGTSFWMLNGIKQFIACTVIFGFTDLLVKKKYIAYIIVVLLLSMIHTSCLVMIPFAFIVQAKPWSWRMAGFISLGLLSVVFVDVFADVSSLFLEDTLYAGKENVIFAGEAYGANIFRFAFTALVPIAALIMKTKISAIASPVINICINFSVITAGINLMAAFTSGTYMGRMPIYTVFYNYILIPWMLKNCFDKKTAAILTCAVLLVFTVYFYYESSGFSMPYYSQYLDIYI